jgi:protein-disulfide isomerase
MEKPLPPKSHKHPKNIAREQRRASARQKQRLSILLVVLGAVLGGALLWPAPPPPPVSATRLIEDPTLGAPTAQIIMVEYGDFGCSSCRAWHQAGILEQVRATYGEQVQFVWRDFPVITAQSPKAAEAAQCAYDQGKFWEYHDFLYERASSLAVQELKTYAMDLGLDTNVFNQCLDSGTHRATVDRDLQQALQFGFRGTPSFQVNGQTLVGPPSFEYLQSLIDPLLVEN